MNEIEKALSLKFQAEIEINEIIKKFKSELPANVHMVREIRFIQSMGTQYAHIELIIE